MRLGTSPATAGMTANSTRPLQPEKLMILQARWLALGLFCACFLAILLSPTTADAQRRTGKEDATPWHTGAAFQRQLQSSVSFTWHHRKFREGLDQLSQLESTAIFFDRRLDPGVPISIDVADLPLQQALQRIARKGGGGIGIVGDVVYIGPLLASTRIATLVEMRNQQIRQLPKPTQRRLLKKRALQWPALTEPRLLLARIATGYGMSVPNIQAVPHDLWASNDLPPLDFAEQVTLVLAGFNANFRIHKSAKQILLSRFPRAVAIERRYTDDDPDALAAKYEKQFPQAFISVDEDTHEVIVKTIIEDHKTIEAAGKVARAAKRSPKKSDPDLQRHTLTVKDRPAGPLLTLLGKKLSVDITMDSNIPREQLDQRVSISVREVTTSELLTAVATQAGWEITFDDGQATVTRGNQ